MKKKQYAVISGWDTDNCAYSFLECASIKVFNTPAEARENFTQRLQDMLQEEGVYGLYRDELNDLESHIVFSEKLFCKFKPRTPFKVVQEVADRYMENSVTAVIRIVETN